MCIGREGDGGRGWVQAASSTCYRSIQGLCNSSVGELTAAPDLTREQEATKHRMALGNRVFTGVLSYQDFTGKHRLRRWSV